MLIGHVLELAHNKLSHNGISCTYIMLKRLYFWKGMKVSVTKHVKNCAICQKCNPQVVPYAKLHFDTATFPMEFISMNLIGEFYPPSKLGHKYIFSDNGTEFKNKLFEQIAKELGIKHKIYTAPYRPSSNG